LLPTPTAVASNNILMMLTVAVAKTKQKGFCRRQFENVAEFRRGGVHRCLFVYAHDISKTDAARIAKLDV